MNSERPSASPSRDRPLLHGVDWAVHAGVTEEVMLGTRRHVRRRRQRRFALAGAAGACAMMGAVWCLNLPKSIPTATVPPASTVVAVPARQMLPDGTVVELKDGAEISVAYSTSARRVALLRGEAHFQVTKDNARPFIVAVNSIEVRAVGTSFFVQRRSSQVEVLVTTGRVAVDRVTGNPATAQASAPQTIATLEAGNRTLVDAAASAGEPVVEVVSPAEIGQRLAWRTLRLEFTRTPLAEAIAMINQHSPVQLLLADSALGSVRISGLLRVDNVDSLFRLLEAEHGIKAEQRSSTEVVLRSGR
ncbi:MAG: FecR family protein [Opitutaceae bacterium]